MEIGLGRQAIITSQPPLQSTHTIVQSVQYNGGQEPTLHTETPNGQRVTTGLLALRIAQWSPLCGRFLSRLRICGCHAMTMTMGRRDDDEAA